MWGPLWRIPKRMACIVHSCSSSNHGILRVSTTRPDGSERGLPQKCGLKPRKRGFDQHQLEFATSMLQVADLGQLHTACGNHLPIHHARVAKRWQKARPRGKKTCPAVLHSVRGGLSQKAKHKKTQERRKAKNQATRKLRCLRHPIPLTKHLPSEQNGSQNPQRRPGEKTTSEKRAVMWLDQGSAKDGMQSEDSGSRRSSAGTFSRWSTTDSAGIWHTKKITRFDHENMGSTNKMLKWTNEKTGLTNKKQGIRATKSGGLTLNCAGKRPQTVWRVGSHCTRYKQQ